MNREEIIRIAQEAGFNTAHDVWPNEFERFAALVAAAEREDILRMSEAQFFKTQADYDDAIRARSQK